MIRSLTQAEIEEQNERIQMLHMSLWLVDNLTAILMDHHLGGGSLNESSAREKAHSILSWMKTVVQIELPAKR